RERYYLEGNQYFNFERTQSQAIAAYKTAVELYPDHASARHNLALVYSNLERYEDAIPHYEELRRRGMEFPSTYDGLAEAYAAIGQMDKAIDVLQDYVMRHPDIASGYAAEGDFLALAGRFDEAAAA